jgi:hypothetical protein
MAFPSCGSFTPYLGTLLVASLNQYLEQHFDAQMQRTRRRPRAARRLEPLPTLWFGILHAGELLRGIHSAQAKDSSMHVSRRSSRRYAATYRMGVVGEAEP